MNSSISYADKMCTEAMLYRQNQITKPSDKVLKRFCDMPKPKVIISTATPFKDNIDEINELIRILSTPNKLSTSNELSTSN